MESLLGKRCFLKRSFAISEEDFPINLTGTIGNVIFNQIKIVKDPWEFGNDQYGLCFCNCDDIIYIVGSIYEGIFNNGVDTWFTVTGGEDVNDPTTIEKIASMCKYIVCEQSYFQKSLDFKIIEFNRKIVGFPVSDMPLKIDGEFKIRLNNYQCFYANSIELDRFAARFKFIGAIETLEYYFDGGDTTWLLRRNNGGGGSEFSVVVCEDFMYTGLENNEEFMRWLSRNAKITPKKHKDRKVTSLKDGCTLVFDKDFHWGLAPLTRLAGRAFGGYLNGSHYHRLEPFYIDEYGNMMADSVHRVPNEDMIESYGPAPEYGPSVPGDYYCHIFFGYDCCHLTYENGLQQTLDYPVTITNVDDSIEDPYLIDYLQEAHVKIIPAYVNGGTYEFKSVLSAFPTIGEGRQEDVARGMVSYNSAGNEIVRYIEHMILVPSSSSNQSIDRIEFVLGVDDTSPVIGYSFVEQKWYCSDSDAVPEDVIIKHFSPVPISNFCVDWHTFSKWVVENTNNFYMVKGSNTLEEFLTEICDLIRVNDPASRGRHTGKIRKFSAQDALSKLSDILP